MSFFRTFRSYLSAGIKKAIRRPARYDIRPAAHHVVAANGISAGELEKLEHLAAKFPSMGGKEIGPFLRSVARNAPPHTAIIEVGSWLGAGTAQLAIGVRERREDRSVSIYTYDRWIASKPEIEKASQKAGLNFEQGADTLPWVMDSLRPFEVPIAFIKGDIAAATWNGEPISVYVDDAAKMPAQFFHVLRTFGPAWIPGVTMLVLMDYHYWEKTASEEHKCQKYFIESHREHFAPVEGFRRASNAAFIYLKALDFGRLKYDSLLRPPAL